MPVKKKPQLIEKHMLLMKYEMMQNGVHLFEQDGLSPEDESGEEALLMRDDIWKDMGKPKKLTVTVESGDKLNAES